MTVRAIDKDTFAREWADWHRLHEENGTTIVIVTHDPGVGLQCARRVILKDGEIDFDQKQPKTRPTPRSSR